MSASLDFYKASTEDQRRWDFFRCYKCNALFTQEEERIRVIEAGRLVDDRAAYICTCKSRRYSPSFPKGLEWLRWGVIRYTMKCVLAREIYPRAQKHFKAALPLIERLVQPKEA
jgi:hypothetical protein